MKPDLILFPVALHCNKKYFAFGGFVILGSYEFSK